jgi:hypothetical protein
LRPLGFGDGPPFCQLGLPRLRSDMIRICSDQGKRSKWG